ncbi:tetratricopeptide repeat protein [Planosporangium thailandense]|uniref:Tetratricopeptide repeat protein n=1 Tax=Planosporangium thailandense TaxID=765197 RepID=A0ABX0Y8S0_9ACTN|nr:tetratricopeptide repeat protein [Planosporangium thailandense]
MDLYAEYERAVRSFDAGDPLGAVRALAPVVAAEPDNSSVRLLLARAYYHSAQLRRAEEQLRWLIDRDPADHYAHFVLGRTLERLGRPGQALPHLRMAVAMRPLVDYTDALRRVEARAVGSRGPRR